MISAPYTRFDYNSMTDGYQVNAVLGNESVVPPDGRGGLGEIVGGVRDSGILVKGKKLM